VVGDVIKVVIEYGAGTPSEKIKEDPLDKTISFALY
jgi:hypothetical protein